MTDIDWTKKEDLIYEWEAVAHGKLLPNGLLTATILFLLKRIPK